MKRYFKYLVKLLKVIGIITLIITPTLLAVMISYHTNNYYWLFLLSTYIFIIPILVIIAEDSGINLKEYV